ncbi:bifunctional 2-C-methyl-D-erythritol 4-phosphate cytidylyltransferase/2-C-methyl-D-erythritol 2,4-cyclodiphosphate synthase [Aurantimonas sp. MSK8Z-1]|uniref:bifunctional 2-C-methyl-D-erythritol 4-phosphate cytidylyltransferase/2-C-methyl-D-erythritol 2,4-cyclodiphosphate synthase n=1 Tax=Mangrovibrevibacter kandeliae TaxID=2968473 RepID=UPI0021184BFA|nr:bifunctional 2-C-methyl-D-erythritol 4-phosphate cytidylyltransferase/2-C-methyl-D-erythritol 2,4-cyclodiphosphate synthase [Aurantimonas sp. MSK8Z-1]MCW4114585.1 bifunctional 2-C-methyl-D-erythritol 4-phosphate cytidylyltransferase/2-C-methyl-D-erythritol 2,4-cyclodiphosphate synthase [Aurantimonas sp. MSK8Z-1]
MKSFVAAIIVAGGRGERAGQTADGPKQYQRIGGVPVIRRTLERFLGHPRVDRVVAVIHADDGDRFRMAAGDLADRVLVATGGTTRQASVRAGLAALQREPPEVVLIQDAARAFTSPDLIDRVIDGVTEATAALPALAVSDTLKRADGDGVVSATVDRAGLFGAQTPQGFPYAAILRAHEAAAASGRSDFTDDSALAEWAGLTVRLVEGDPDNLKLTLARDIVMADERLRNRPAMIDVRTGNGYDVHQLVEGDHVTLCGVRIAHDQRLKGHSDADVGLHALTDALLATCGAGDIGDHFPPSDPQWKGAPSHIFVEKAVSIVRGRGGRIANADISLICEAPKIAPHREAMRLNLSAMLGIALERVSVKATTNETIGFVGRREGIAAIATASVIYGDGA